MHAYADMLLVQTSDHVLFFRSMASVRLGRSMAIFFGRSLRVVNGASSYPDYRVPASDTWLERA